jgi:hypothetical protein
VAKPSTLALLDKLTNGAASKAAATAAAAVAPAETEVRK